MKQCLRVLKSGTVLFSVCIAACTTSFGQICYPTSIINKSNGNNTNVTYDDKNNIVSLVYTLGGTVTTYTTAIEKTPTGYKKIFLTKVDDSPAQAFTPTRTEITYNNNNRLQLAEGSNDKGLHMTEKYFYNASDQLVRIESESSFKDPTGKILNDHGQVTYSYPNT